MERDIDRFASSIHLLFHSSIFSRNIFLVELLMVQQSWTPVTAIDTSSYYSQAFYIPGGS